MNFKPSVGQYYNTLFIYSKYSFKVYIKEAANRVDWRKQSKLNQSAGAKTTQSNSPARHNADCGFRCIKSRRTTDLYVQILNVINIICDKLLSVE